MRMAATTKRGRRTFAVGHNGRVLADAPPPPPPAVQASALSSIQLAGQRVVFAFSGTTVPVNLRKRIARGEAAGVILFGANVASIAQVRRLTRELQAIRRPAGLRAPLIVMTDQEGGLVKRLPGHPTKSPPQMRSAAEARDQGRATARTLRAAGVNIDLAPVVDVARPGSQMEREGRSFGRSTSTVSRRARAFVDGLRAGGVLGTAKHFPGFGAASANTDNVSVVIRSPLRTLRRVDEPPFKASGAPLVMVSSAIYPALSDQPGLLSRRVVTGELRDHLGFTGVTVTDSLNAGALVREPSVLKRAVRAGDDLLLFTSYAASAHAVERLATLLRRGRLDRATATAAVARILTLRRKLII
jgi:beta-N-acetylhexosaminidase